MKLCRRYWGLLLCCFLQSQQNTTYGQSHEVYFCGERIPVENGFVANKLMDIIRRQIPNVNMPALRQKANLYLPYIVAYLKNAGIPEDFKYLPIVESGFNLLTSSAGARGIWQIMPATGTGLGLKVNSAIDERDDFHKATEAACQVIKGNYNALIKLNKIASWVWAAAAYNFGAGSVSKAIQRKGKDYFTMDLNKETAAYVYKIIAVKELFEYPELYMQNFGYNIFSTQPPPEKLIPQEEPKIDEKIFENTAIELGSAKEEIATTPVYITAHIDGKYKEFTDGTVITIKLNDDLHVQGDFAKKGSTISGVGWIIDGRIYVDLGYGHDLTLCDVGSEKGIPLTDLKKKQPVLLKNDLFVADAQPK